MRTLEVFILTAALVIVTARPEVFVDSFSAGPFLLSPSSDSGNVTVSADSSHVAGGARWVEIRQEGNIAIPRSSVEIQAQTGFLDYTRRQNGDFLLDYGLLMGGFWLPGQEMNVNLLAGGNDHLALEVLAAPGPFSLRVKVIDNGFYERHQATVVLEGATPGTYLMPFSSFGSVEFDKVAGVELWMPVSYSPPDNGPGLYRFGSFSAVPEPQEYASATAAFVLLLFLVGRFSRRFGGAKVISVVLAVMHAPCTTSGQVVIDSFNAAPFSFTPSGDFGTMKVSGDASHIAGGTRWIAVTQEGYSSIPHSTISVAPGSGHLDYNRTQNGWLYIGYGAYVDDPLGHGALTGVPMNLDLTVGGNDRLSLSVLTVPGPFFLGVKVLDNSFFQRNERYAFIDGTGPGTYSFLFSDFNGPVEFDKIGGIELSLAAVGGPPYNGPGLYRFESFAAVPEVREWQLITGSGLVVFLFCRSRWISAARGARSGAN